MPIYYVGIDVSKFKHTCCVLSQDGVVERPSFDFPNSKEGFGLLKKTMASLGPKEQILIGMEATGHYGLCLQKALWGEGYKLKVYNPLTIEKFRGSEAVAGAKTDKLDALLIAKYMSSRPFSPTEAMDGAISEIQSLERAKYFLFRDRTRCFNHLHRYLDVSFPELPRFLATKGDGGRSSSRTDVFESKTAMALVGRCPSAAKAARLTKKDADALRRMSMGRFSLVKSARLRELARSSIGSSDPATEAVIRSLVEQARCIGEQIDSIDAVLRPLMEGLNTPVLSIPGVGPGLGAMIVGEIGDAGRFGSPDKLVKFAGLDVKVYQSGTVDRRGRLGKKGSPILRYALVCAAMKARIHSPTFAAYYAKKIAEGKYWMTAIVDCARKLLRIVWKLMTTGEKFEEQGETAA